MIHPSSATQNKNKKHDEHGRESMRINVDIEMIDEMTGYR